MKKPYMICHMICGVDGRTQTRHWPKGQGSVFEDTAKKIDNQGWIVGRVTMAEFCAQTPRRKRSGRFDVAKTDYIAPHKQKTYAIGLDPTGKLHWKTGNVDTEHAVMIVTEKVTGDYLDHLQKAGVSYIFGGKTKIDFKKVAAKLYTLLGIKRVTIQGGGHNNGSWLNEGLIDELSLVVMPFADGTPGAQTTFDIPVREQKRKAHSFKLVSMKKYKSNYVWLRYKVLN